MSDSEVTGALKARPERLPLRIKLGFGVGDLGGNLFFTVIGFYLLNYLTESVGMAAGLAGTALMIGKVWDAVTDPAVGYISDRTRSRFGRRRPYMAAGAIVTMVFMVLMFTNMGITDQTALFVYVAVIYCLLNTGYTLINIPYGALTPELTADFDERTVLNGYRMSFAVVGTLIGAAAVVPLVGIFGGGDRGWALTGSLMGVIIALTTMITVVTVREKLGEPVKEAVNVIRSYLQVLRMREFLTALIPWSLHITGVNVIQASLLYYFQYIYKAPGMFSFALLFLLVGSLIFIPIWVKVSEKIGKKRSYNIGMLIFAGAVLVFFALGAELPVGFSFVIMGIAGIGFATQYVMPFAIVPDVVEFDYAENGRRREGVFYGMWTFMSKIGQAFAIALSGWVLALSGYQEATAAVPEPTQSASAILGIRLLTGPIPAAFFLLGVLVLTAYPITREAYDGIMLRIKERGEENG